MAMKALEVLCIILDLMRRCTFEATATQAAAACRLTNFDAQTQGSHYENIRSGHTTHGLSAIDCKLPAVQILVDLHAIGSFVGSVDCMTILHLELLSLGKVLRW
jgi:hypothetical protein